MSARTDLRAVYHGGAYFGGWQCSNCRREFRHGGRAPLLTFARTVAHTVKQHRRLPRPVRVVRWEWFG